MSNKVNLAVLGCPGSGKSCFGLSAPGVEQHVFGSSEDTTAENFSWRADILKPVKFSWYDSLKDEEKPKFVDENVSEIDVAKLMQVARARNIAKYRRYLYGLKNAFAKGERQDLKTIFMDNGTPFSQDFEDYVRITFGHEFTTENTYVYPRGWRGCRQCRARLNKEQNKRRKL